MTADHFNSTNSFLFLPLLEFGEGQRPAFGRGVGSSADCCAVALRNRGLHSANRKIYTNFTLGIFSLILTLCILYINIIQTFLNIETKRVCWITLPGSFSRHLNISKS